MDRHEQPGSGFVATGSEPPSQVAGHDDGQDTMSISWTQYPWGDGSAPSLPSADDRRSEAGDEFDSALGEMSAVSSTMSVRSSVYELVEENGRTYHRFKQGKYLLPNDEREQERLDLQHNMFTMGFGGRLYLAPIVSPHNVLDVGTGTGIWAMEFAELHPEASVVGTDLSPIQPVYVPPNCRFEIDDAEDEWIFSERFDYIHGRALVSCFASPKYVLEQAYKSLSPGGYLEFQDAAFPCKYIGEIPTDCALYKWGEYVVAGAEKAGRPWTNVPNYAKWMREIGFEEVVEKSFAFPVNPWAKGKYYKELGVMVQENLSSALEGASLKIMKLLGWTTEDILAFLPEVRQDLMNPNIHAYMPITVVYGRRPLNAS